MSEPLRLSGTLGLGRLRRGTAVQPRPVCQPLCSQGAAAARSATLEAAIGGVRPACGADQRRRPAKPPDILEFQVAMLEDDALTGPAFDAIRRRQASRLAWRTRSTPRSPATRRRTTTISARGPPTCAISRDQVLRALTEEATSTAPRRHPLRRGHRADALSGDRLEVRRRHRAAKAGSPASHVAMLARSRGVPMVVASTGDAPAVPGTSTGCGTIGCGVTPSAPNWLSPQT